MANDFKATVVSTVPFEIKQVKPGLFPGEFIISPAPINDFSILVVGESIHWVQQLSDLPRIKARTPADQIAESIVNDYINDCFGADKSTGAVPGLFWVIGGKTKIEIKKDHAAELAAANERQKRWFTFLVRVADDTWERGHQHQQINDIQRHAARALGLDGKRDWMTLIPESVSTCPGCGMSIVSPSAICSNCKCILDPAKYAALQFAGVK